MGKNHIERLLEIDRRIRSNRYPGRKEIADHFEVSIKTIERDLEYMKYRLNAPIEYDRTRKGFYYSIEGFFIPDLFLTEGDALYLFMSHYLGVEWNQAPFNTLGDKAIKQLSQLFPDSISLNPISLSSRIDFFRKVKIKPNQADIWLIILKGAEHHQKIKIYYRPPGHDDPLEITIHPYRLINHNRIWYVSAINDDLQELRTYSITRMEKAIQLAESFNKVDGIDPLEGMDKNFGIYHEGKAFTVILRTDKRTADMIEEELIDFSRKTNKKGDILICFSTNQYHELLYWLLKWSQNIEVLEPKEIRKELLSIGKNFLSLYGGNS